MSDRRETLARHLGMIQDGEDWYSDTEHQEALQWADEIIAILEEPEQPFGICGTPNPTTTNHGTGPAHPNGTN